MGLSLKILKKLDPFHQDAAVTDQAPMMQKIATAKYGVLANNPTAQGDLIRSTQPSFTGLNALPNAFNDATRQVLVQPALKGPVELVNSFRHHSFTPTTPAQKFLLGDGHIDPIQKKVSDQYQRQSTSSNPLVRMASRPLAAAEAVTSLAADVPAAGALLRGGKMAVRGLKGVKEAKAIEAAAPVTNIPAAIQATKPMALPTVSFKEPPGTVSAVDKIARSTTGVLNKIDPRLGEMVHRRRELAETSAAMAKSQLQVTNTLKKSEQTNLARVLKGTERPISSRVLEAAVESRSVLNNIYKQGKAAGVDIPAYRKNYFPQIHNPKTFEKGSQQYNDAVDHLINTKQANGPAEAIRLLRSVRNQKTLSPYGNLSKSRKVDLPGYAENRAALHQYITRSYATIAHHQVMGVKDANLNKVLADVRKNGGDYEAAIKAYRQASGLERGSDAGERASRIATNFQGATKLGMSSVGNATQTSNTAIVGGVGRTAKNMVKQFTKTEKDFLARTGVKDEQVSHEALFGEQGVSGKIRNITAPGFEHVEKFNRSVAALTGRDQAVTLAKKAAKGDVKAATKLRDEFGIADYSKDGLSEANQIKAARAFVERTQFRTGQQDLPAWASTPAGRVVSQFKRYPYKQTQFIKREVIDQARKGNLAPTVRLAALGAPVALGANAAQDKLRGNNFQPTGIEKAVDMATTATGSDLVGGLARSLYPSSKDSNAYISKVGKAITGPTGSDSIKAIQGSFEAAKGNSKNLERFGLSHIPVVGVPTSNRVLPYPAKGTSTASTKTSGNKDIINAAFGTPEAKSFLKLSDADKKLAAQADPATRDLYDKWQAMKGVFQSPKLRPQGLDQGSTQILDKYDRLTTQAKDKYFLDHNGAEYEYAKAKYASDVANGTISGIDKIKRENTLLRDKVGSSYQKDTRDLYGLNKSDVYDYVKSNPDGGTVFKKVLAYDDALVKAGVISKNKYRDKYGNVNLDPSTSSSSRGGAYRGSRGLNDAYGLTVKSVSGKMRVSGFNSGGTAPHKKFVVKQYKPKKSKVKAK